MKSRFTIPLALCVIFSSVPVKAGYSFSYSQITTLSNNDKMFLCCSLIAFFFTSYLIKKYKISSQFNNKNDNDNIHKNIGSGIKKVNKDVKSEKKDYYDVVQNIKEEKFTACLANAPSRIKEDVVKKQWKVLLLIKDLHKKTFCEAIKLFNDFLTNNNDSDACIVSAYYNLSRFILGKQCSTISFIFDTDRKEQNIKEFIRLLQRELIISITDEKITKEDILKSVSLYAWDEPIINVLIDDYMKEWKDNSYANCVEIRVFVDKNHDERANDEYFNDYVHYNKNLLTRVHKFICEKQNLVFPEKVYNGLSAKDRDSSFVSYFVERMDVDLYSKLIE